MRKSLVSFVFLALCLAFSGVSAHAQTAVGLTFGAGQVVFSTITAGSTASATFKNTVGIASSTLPFGVYSFTLTGSPVLLTQTGPGVFNTSGTLTLNIFSGSGTLTGTVNLEQFNDYAPAPIGIFNNAFVTNVTGITATGSLKEYNSISGGLLLTLVLPTSNQVDELMKPVKIIGGSGTLLPSPEPTSLLLFGSGLLALGGALRRRLLASA